MKFNFGCISNRPDVLMDMCRHFISGSVYMIFCHSKWNFISVKVTDIKSISPLSFKRTCALIATSNESALIHFVSGKVCSVENLIPVWVHFSSHVNIILLFTWKTRWGLKFHFGQFDRSELCTEVSFTMPEVMWTLIMKLPHTEVKSQTGLSSLRVSCKRALIISPWN